MKRAKRHILLVVSLVWSSPALADDLALICEGVGTYPSSQSGMTTAVNPNTGDVVTGVRTTNGQAATNGTVRFRLEGDTALINTPIIMDPPINRSPVDGWREVECLNVSETEITGRFVLNRLNRPRVRIDRYTGAITIEGRFRYSFQGDCEAETLQERRF
jgi:hypothetical protein